MESFGKSSMKDLLSVVVIGRNEGSRLERCLASINRMHMGGSTLQLIYVDSGSSDRSCQVAREAGATVLELGAGRTTAAMGRNAGWRVAQGSLVFFLDGDTIVHPDFFAKAHPSFEDPAVAIVWGHRRELATDASLYNRVLDLDWIYAPGLTSFCGGDAIFRKSFLALTGGFDDQLIAGEEPELCRRITALDGRILHVDLPMTGHDLAMTHFGQYWRRALRAGHAFAEVSERFRLSAHPFWLTDARRNRNRALTLLGGGALAVIASTLTGSAWPLGCGTLMLAAISLRTAWKARWKTSDRVALLLYGLHSQLQQVPILMGQMQFRLNRRRGVKRGLVEYKRS